MNQSGMFLAMLLSNARRAEALSVLLSAEPAPRIELLMSDGARRPFPTPPLETVRALIELLENGEREFAANVHTARVEDVEITRQPNRFHALIRSWEIEK